MFCSKCGNELLDGETTCPNCGATETTNCPPVQQEPVVTSEPAKRKSANLAGILGILLGSLGIHNFYLGYTKKGLAQLLITVLTFGFGAGITSVWGLVEGILILTGNINEDANGTPLEK